LISAYYFLYGTLAVLLAAYIPGIIAAEKEHRFSVWYIYGVVLLPVAIIHSLLLKKPTHLINVFTHDKNNPLKRKKKTYASLPREKRRLYFSPKHIYAVFFSKLLFGAFVAFSVFAIFRTLVHGTESLRRACVIFAILFAVLLAVVELCRYSRFPLIADEITKRALIIISFSIACSLPFYLLKTFIADVFFTERFANLAGFLLSMFSSVLFVVLLLRRERVYYSFFGRFSEYCILNMCAYAMYAAISLVWMSVTDFRDLVYLVSMPAQLFNMNYISEIKALERLPYIYSSALIHLIIEGIIFVSGLLCLGFKKKEMAFRVEYRSKAFRMSRKRVLRRHIPKIEKVKIKR